MNLELHIKMNLWLKTRENVMNIITDMQNRGRKFTGKEIKKILLRKYYEVMKL